MGCAFAPRINDPVQKRYQKESQEPSKCVVTNSQPLHYSDSFELEWGPPGPQIGNLVQKKKFTPVREAEKFGMLGLKVYLMWRVIVAVCCSVLQCVAGFS